jgi:dephospho-CoA kinase
LRITRKRNVTIATEAQPGIFTVGLTGGIGSGKSTVAREFETRGICVVDTDAIAHELTAPGGAAMPAIVASFGTAMALPNGALDRPSMRKRVFDDPQAKLTLEGILHPLIRTESLRRLTQAQSPYAMLVVPLLLETEVWQQACDRLLVIDCAEETQIRRVMSRNGMSREEVQRIMATQIGRQLRLAAATEIIDNDGSPDTLSPRIDAIHRQYLLAAKKP